MRLATVRLGDGHTRAARLEGDRAVLLDAPDVGAVLRARGAERSEEGRVLSVEELDYAPLIPAPGKIACVGQNYRRHIEEMGRGTLEHPTWFAKFADALTGARDAIELPAVSSQVDWEVELALVIGSTARRVPVARALECIAGYAVANDVSMRDWQYRTTQFLAGKTFEASTPLGPWLVTPDEVDHARDLRIRSLVDGEVVQDSSTGDLVFDAAQLVADLSQVVTLRPGDVLLTGTPGGVGFGRDPKVFLRPGQRLVSEIEGLGSCDNLLVAPAG